MNILETKLTYHFKDTALLEQALIHRSFSQDNNERLEFLGDGCLNFIMAEALFTILPQAKEGELSNLRAYLVKEETLANIALEELSLNQYIRLSRGEKKSDGAKRPSLLADTMEAIIGAIYLDGSYKAAKKTVLHLYNPHLVELRDKTIPELNEHFKDPKSRLQEYLQALTQDPPHYKVIDIRGKDHEQLFKVACHYGEKTTVATGTSKKRAEQDAARAMLELLD